MRRHGQCADRDDPSAGVSVMIEACAVSSLFRRPETSRAYAALSAYDYPWELLPHLSECLEELMGRLDGEEFSRWGAGIYVSRYASIAPTAAVYGPCLIEAGAQIRHGAFLRGGVLVGRDAVVGNSCELKNCILFEGAQVPHFNYVGDSILGFHAHLGAGAVTSNVKGDRTPVTVRVGAQHVATGMRKLGAMVGDGAEVGCNAVLNPGTVLGPGARVYPLSSVRGFVPGDAILKADRGIVPKTP